VFAKFFVLKSANWSARHRVRASSRLRNC